MTDHIQKLEEILSNKEYKIVVASVTTKKVFEVKDGEEIAQEKKFLTILFSKNLARPVDCVKFDIPLN